MKYPKSLASWISIRKTDNGYMIYMAGYPLNECFEYVIELTDEEFNKLENKDKIFEDTQALINEIVYKYKDDERFEDHLIW